MDRMCCNARYRENILHGRSSSYLPSSVLSSHFNNNLSNSNDTFTYMTSDESTNNNCFDINNQKHSYFNSIYDIDNSNFMASSRRAMRMELKSYDKPKNEREKLLNKTVLVNNDQWLPDPHNIEYICSDCNCSDKNLAQPQTERCFSDFSKFRSADNINNFNERHKNMNGLQNKNKYNNTNYCLDECENKNKKLPKTTSSPKILLNKSGKKNPKNPTTNVKKTPPQRVLHCSSVLRSPKYSSSNNRFYSCPTDSDNSDNNKNIDFPTKKHNKSITNHQLSNKNQTTEMKCKFIMKTDDDIGSSSEESSLDEDDYDDVSEYKNSCESSSDSDSEYQSAYIKQLEKTKSLSITQVRNLQMEYVPTVPNSLFSPSLFPNVPPYLSFSTHTDKGPLVFPEIHKLLKWKQSKVMPKVVRIVLLNSGCRLLKNTNDWMGTWCRHMKSPCFRSVRPYQKINHLPGSFGIGRKDSCWKKLKKQMIKFGKKEFGFMPKTYIFPQDLNSLRKSWPKYCENNTKWIIKPPASARGTGIKVVNMWCQIPKRKALVVQKYIERPLLINGSKFDLRLYVLVTSINPLRVYLYNDGLARFASVKYSNRVETLYERCMHLTNYSINKKSMYYSKNDNVDACTGHKWTIKSLWKYLAAKHINTELLWNAIINLILRTLFAGENAMNNMIRLNVSSRYSCFELFGFDILLDSELVPWLLEVNISPSLHSELPLDSHVKGPLVQAVLNTALYHLPPKLSAEKEKEISNRLSLKSPLCYDKRMYVTYLSQSEKIKHNIFTRKNLEDRDQYINAILENLTPDDVRCLITSEDELSKSGPLERIFPTNKTFKFLKYTEYPRYYNRLLDAWENRYAGDRKQGISQLREHCKQNYHLQVPPPPIQRGFWRAMQSLYWRCRAFYSRLLRIEILDMDFKIVFIIIFAIICLQIMFD